MRRHSATGFGRRTGRLARMYHKRQFSRLASDDFVDKKHRRNAGAHAFDRIKGNSGASTSEARATLCHQRRTMGSHRCCAVNGRRTCPVSPSGCEHVGIPPTHPIDRRQAIVGIEFAMDRQPRLKRKCRLAWAPAAPGVPDHRLGRLHASRGRTARPRPWLPSNRWSCLRYRLRLMYVTSSLWQ